MPLCADCLRDLPRLEQACPRCAEPLPAPLTPTGSDEIACGRCLADPPPYLRSFAPLRYARPVDWMVGELKFRQRLAAAQALGVVLADALHAQLARRPAWRPDAILPVPLHPKRLRERGFNQAVEIARPVARRLGIPLALNWARRQRATVPQHQQSLDIRARNLRGAFEIRRSLHGEHIAILDDVVTSGHTVAELARALNEAGAGAVSVWSAARAQLRMRA